MSVEHEILQLIEILQAISTEESHKRSQEYNMDLQRYNSRLQSDLESTSKLLKQLETEKTSIVENLRTFRGHNNALQDKLASVKVSHYILTYVFLSCQVS